MSTSEAILNMFRTNHFHLHPTGCALVAQKDLQYWEIGEVQVKISIRTFLIFSFLIVYVLR